MFSCAFIAPIFVDVYMMSHNLLLHEKVPLIDLLALLRHCSNIHHVCLSNIQGEGLRGESADNPADKQIDFAPKRKNGL